MVKTDPHGYYLATIAYAFIIDAVFIIIALARVFFVTVSVDVFSVQLFVDITILSLLVIGFLIIVAYINQRITTDAQQLIKRTITETTAKLIDVRSLKTKKDRDKNDQETLENAIQYLSAMSDFIENEKTNYCIQLFRCLIIDMDMVLRIVGSVVVGLASVIFSYVRSKSLLA